MRFGEFLILEGRATEEQVAMAVVEQRRRGLPLGQLALREGVLTPEQLAELLEQQLEHTRYRRLGRLACDAGWMTESELVGLLRMQRALRPRLGELLVEFGVLQRAECAHLAQRHERLHYGKDSSSGWPVMAD